MNLRAGISFLGLLFFIMTLSGCNIFEWTSSPDEGEDLLEEGLDFMFDGDFDAAESLFALGLLTDPLNSDLLYNHAKATLLKSGESIITIIDEITKFSDNSAADVELPFFGLDEDRQNNLYKTNIIIFNDLSPIFDSTIVTTGSIEKSDITLDIFIANTVKGILRIADTNNDGEIKSPPDIDFSMFTTGSGGFEFDSSFVDSLGPEDLNNLIESVGAIIENGGDIFGDLFGDSDIETGAIDSLMGDITGSLEWYYVNTGVEGNPGIGNNDADRPGSSPDVLTDEECINQLDDDDDGLIDEDALIDSEIIKLFPQWLPGDPCPL